MMNVAIHFRETRNELVNVIPLMRMAHIIYGGIQQNIKLHRRLINIFF